VPRFILIHNPTGVISGDTAQFAPDEEFGLTPLSAARILDESMGAYARHYVERARNPHDAGTGYDVYVATDANGSDLVPVVTDGEDRSLIESVRRACPYAAYIEYAPASEGESWKTSTESVAG